MPMNDNQHYVIDYIGVMGKPNPTKTAETAEEFEYMKKIVKQAFRKHTIKEATKEYEL